MLQISQIEKPTCSAAMDQMRLRRATNLSLDSQHFSASGFQSANHVAFRLLIENFPAGSCAVAQKPTVQRPRKARANFCHWKNRQFCRPPRETCAVCTRCGVNFVQSLRSVKGLPDEAGCGDCNSSQR